MLYQSRRMERRLIELLANAIESAMQSRSMLDTIERITISDIGQLRQLLERRNDEEEGEAARPKHDAR